MKREGSFKSIVNIMAATWWISSGGWMLDTILCIFA